MSQRTLSGRFLVSLTCFLLLIFVDVLSSFAQPRTQRANTTSRPSNAPTVIARYIEALQKRDFRTVIDLTHPYQQEIAVIRSQNPRVLWPKLIGEYYQGKISLI